MLISLNNSSLLDKVCVGTEENESIDDSSSQVSVLLAELRECCFTQKMSLKYAWFQRQTGYEWPNMQISTTISMQIWKRTSLVGECINWPTNTSREKPIVLIAPDASKKIGSSPTCWIQFFIVQITANTSLEPSQLNLQYKPQLLCAGNRTLESPQTKPCCNKRPNCCKLHCCVSGHKFKTNRSCTVINPSIECVCHSRKSLIELRNSVLYLAWV